MVTDATAQFIANWEGLRTQQYYCLSHVLTVGYGHAVRPGEDFSKGITREQAMVLLKQDLASAEGCAKKALGPTRWAKFTEKQQTAIISLIFNIGNSGFTNSTLCKLLKAGKMEEASLQFIRWNKGGNPLREIVGLTRRRSAETLLFNSAFKLQLTLASDFILTSQHAAFPLSDEEYVKYARAA